MQNFCKSFSLLLGLSACSFIILFSNKCQKYHAIGLFCFSFVMLVILKTELLVVLDSLNWKSYSLFGWWARVQRHMDYARKCLTFTSSIVSWNANMKNNNLLIHYWVIGCEWFLFNSHVFPVVLLAFKLNLKTNKNNPRTTTLTFLKIFLKNHGLCLSSFFKYSFWQTTYIKKIRFLNITSGLSGILILL